MPISLRLDKGLEEKIAQAMKILHISKTEVVKRSLKKYLSELQTEERSTLFAVYQRFENKIPGSGQGALSIDHRTEVLKRIKAKR